MLNAEQLGNHPLFDKNMNIREARVDDIKQIQLARNSVQENILSDPNKVTDKDCEEFITRRGKGWVCEMNGQIVGFAIVDAQDNNVWALFMKPEFEKQGIGKQLHNTMLAWYFEQTDKTIWLGTSPRTRAETFYKKLGWTPAGKQENGEVKFEMTYVDWKNNCKK